jgi:hypothetical protein
MYVYMSLYFKKKLVKQYKTKKNNDESQKTDKNCRYVYFVIDYYKILSWVALLSILGGYYLNIIWGNEIENKV